MKKRYFSLIVLCFSLFIFHFSFFIPCNAQQLPIYTQYMLNDFAMNPAIAGTQPEFNAKTDARFQWVGFTDAPATYILTFDGPITANHIGLGAYIFTDATGPTERTGLTSAYSYRIKINDDLNLSFGLDIGILQFSVDEQSIVTVQSNDQAFLSQNVSVVVPDIGAGIYMYDSKFYAGLAAPQMVESTLKLSTLSDAQSALATHFYATGGYNYDINAEFTLTPSVSINYVSPAPMQFDLGARLIYVKKFWVGAGYRTADAAYAMLGYVYRNNITIGYSYDYSVTDIQKYSSGTSEIFIGIKFPQAKTAEVTDKSKF